MEMFETEKRKPYTINHTIKPKPLWQSSYALHSRAKNDVTALNFHYFHANCHSLEDVPKVMTNDTVCLEAVPVLVTTAMMTTVIVWSGP